MDCTARCHLVLHADLFFSAITREDLQTVQKISKGVCANAAQTRDLAGRAALHVAASCNRNDILEWLIRECGVDVELRDGESNWSALHRSLYYGQLVCAVNLLKHGADLGALDREGWTPMQLLLLDSPLRLWPAMPPEYKLEVFTWGSNTNFTLGHRDDSSRQVPELVEAFNTNKELGIREVVICKFHSVFLSDDGQLFTCGHGRGGRLGHGDEKTLLVPRRVETFSGMQCVAVAAGQDHTVVVTNDGAVFTFGLNDAQQLGHTTAPTQCLLPKMIQFKAWKGKCMTGAAAGRYHTVLYNKYDVYTLGLNAGQLGHPKREKFQTTPRRVSGLCSKEGSTGPSVSLVSCSDSATVCAIDTGDIYLLSQYVCRKISRLKSLSRLVVSGGELDKEIAQEFSRKPSPHDLIVTCLDSNGMVYQWNSQFASLKKCHWRVKRPLSVVDVAMGKQLLIVTDQGEAFTCQPCAVPPSCELGSEPCSTPLGRLAREVTEKKDSVEYALERIPMVHRTHRIFTDSSSRGFAVLQIAPQTGLKRLPKVSESCLWEDIKQLLEEASCDDNIHDVELQVADQSLPAHSFILASRCPAFHHLLCEDKENVLNDRLPESCRKIELSCGVDHSTACRWLDRLYSGQHVTDTHILPNGSFKRMKATATSKRKSVDVCAESFQCGPLIESLVGLDLGYVSASAPDGVMINSDDGCRKYQESAKANRLSKSIPLASECSVKERAMHNDTTYVAKTSTSGGTSLDTGERIEKDCVFSRTSCPELYDVSIESADGVTFDCHKCVLVGRLDYFRSMLACNWLETSSKSTILQLPLPATLLEIIIDFLYTGCAFSHNDEHDIELLCNVLVVADQLLIKRLVEICEAALSQCISLKNVVELLAFSLVYNADQLKDVCVDFICYNLSSLLESRSLDSLSDEVLEDISRAYRNMIPGMAWRMITPMDLHLNVSLEEPEAVPGRRRRSSSRKRLSKGGADTEESEPVHRLSESGVESSGVDIEDHELDVFEDSVGGVSNEGQCSRDSDEPVETGVWYRKVETQTSKSLDVTCPNKKSSKTPPSHSEPRAIPQSKAPENQQSLTPSMDQASSPDRPAWGSPRISSPPTANLKVIMEQEKNQLPQAVDPVPRMKSSPSQTCSRKEALESPLKVEWRTGGGQSQKQRKRTKSAVNAEPGPAEVLRPDNTPMNPWASPGKEPISIKSLRELIEEEEQREKLGKKENRDNTTENKDKSRKKLSFHRNSENSKAEYKRDQRLTSEPPKRAWKVKLEACSPPSTAVMFSTILQSEEQDSAHRLKEQRKPLNLIQIEDHAIEELLDLYGGCDNPCEFVTVERVQYTPSTNPVWRKERSPSSGNV